MSPETPFRPSGAAAHDPAAPAADQVPAAHVPAPPSHAELLGADLADLVAAASAVRDRAHGSRVTYSPKVFIPLTMLCRDRCGYCTFAKAPARLASP